jgi:spermidine synthase
MLGWVFGVTVYAASTVWAMFMAGLAVGSLAAGLIADRVRQPLRWFGCAELLIGITALATPGALDWLQRGYVWLYPSLPHTPAAVTTARIAMAFLVLIVPTALMGATLPLVLKASTFRTGALGGQIGLLYGSNAAGAIAGTLTAGLYLIPQRGIHGTFLVAAALNIIVGASAIAWSVRSRSTVGPTSGDGSGDAVMDRSGSDPETGSGAHSAPRSLNVVLAVFTLSGAVALALEVVWFRVLTLFLRPTVYGFAVMLATILAGIAIGSYLVTPLFLLNRKLRWVFVLGCFEIAIALAVLLSFGPLGYLPQLSAAVTPIVRSILPEYLGYPITGALLAMLPTSLLMGMAFPIGLQFWATGPRRSTRTAGRIGVFYALNVGGAIVGSLAAGFVLLPWLGSRTSLVILAALTFASGLILVAISELTRPRRAAAIAAAVAVFATAWQLSPDPFVQFVAQRYPGQQIVWREEGVEATVVVHQNRGRELSLTVNGNHEASTGGTMTYVHRRIGHLPMAIHKDPRTALVIGLGGGATAGAVSIHDGVRVDVVELAGAVVRGARFFEAINYGVLARPNVRLRVDDGRNYMMLTPNRYDVITADVIIPIFAGSGNLYSVEYFRLMKRVLNPGGLVLQWVAGTDAEYKTITRTFLSVFPETTAWVDGGLLVGSIEPLQLRREDFEQKLNLPGRAQGLKDLGIETFDRLLSVFTAGPDELRAFVGPGPLLTDDRPLAEYFLSLPRDRDPDFTTLKGNVQRYVATE